MNRKSGNKIPEQQLLQTLRQLLGAPEGAPVSFRSEEQKQVIEAILRGRDVLALMPTGAGKSVCYQVPAMHLPGITLVISPLLALMEDQVRKLDAQGVSVACISSAFLFDHDGFHKSIRRDRNETDPPSFRKLRNQIYLDATRGGYKFLYVTPERLNNGGFIRFAQRANISMIAVDEAHCISLWGYDFRPRYLEISRLLTRIGYHPIIAAFTATAAKYVRKDIVSFLDMRRPAEIGSASAKRDNLHFSVRHFPGEDEKKQELLRYLRDNFGSSGFVYCSKVDTVDELWKFLNENGIPAARYYALLDNVAGGNKEKSFQSFLKGRKRVMVSTTALGMGIDKSDVRFVIHYNVPTCLENYYQEAGRAGRDGLPAQCILYHTNGDIPVSKALIERAVSGSTLPEAEKKIYQTIADARFHRMLDYARDGETRDSDELQQQILDYFREFDPQADTPPKERPDVLSRLKRINVLYVNRTKIAQALRKGRMQADDLVIGKPLDRDGEEARDGRQAQYPAPQVSYRVTGAELSYFDLMVADAVFTLMKHRVPTIYARHVMELLSGNEALTLRPERKREVEDSIRKMIRTDIRIDRSNSARYGFVYDDQRDKRILSGPFLPLYEKNSGFGYDPGVLPPLYEYAEILNGQFFTFSTKLLHVSELSAAPKNLAMIHYLLCRIDMMTISYKAKSYHAMTRRRLRFDTMIQTLGLQTADGKWYSDHQSGTPQSREENTIRDGKWHSERKANTLWDEKLIPILTHFQNQGWIEKYEANRTQGIVEIW